MLCQECEEREASLHFTKIINGEKTEVHLCGVCAKDKGDYLPGGKSFSIHQLLSGLLDSGQGKQTKQEGTRQARQRRPELKCGTCGMTYRRFAEVGRFGCADCYEQFDEKLDPVFQRIHGSTQHTGKVPKRKGEDMHVYRELESLRQQMQQKIEEEEFEEAASLRDKIRGLEESLKEKGGGAS
ncbi:UvrB/UvrC motif-containing protein [Alkalicoccus chagannorensis]|uniref:UvrB/UvrC motif-containing protein n=1 Tax=Alkalicoccus chagannorensis TaxID=427072 RepID=UPI0004074FF1|nr:UvrB/UvrC motif-containing protein [Alkalicoccus chagannorensis]